MKKTIIFLLFLALIVASSICVYAQALQDLQAPPESLKSLEAPPELYQNLQELENLKLYPTAGINPWYQFSWNDSYCNNTGMDFLVLVDPTACSPSVIRSDLLEEQDVPVLCRMTGVKINPLIQVPYIKEVKVAIENKSNGVRAVNFLPARIALSYAPYPEEKKAGLEGVPTMNNLGYLWIQLKQQPVEAKMPDKVIVNASAKITYDIAKTFGISENQFVLPLLNQDEWLERYKEFGFWHGKGYLRLQEITGPNRAKVAVYTNPRATPIKVVELREGADPQPKDEIKLPGFYCGAGVSLKLEKITTPSTRARILVNGNELLLENNDPILDSGCIIDYIEPGKGYGGSVKIYCQGNFKILTIKDYEAEIEINDPEQRTLTVTVGNEILINNSKENKNNKVYVGFIGKEYSSEGLSDFVILFSKKDYETIEEKDREKIIEKIHNYVKSKRGATLSYSDSTWKDELRKLFSDSFAKNLNFFVAKTDRKTTVAGVDLKIISVTGPEQVYYTKDVEAIYKETIQKWRDIAFAYAYEPSPEGSYYGVIALSKAAELAKFMHKRLDEAELLRELIDKYANSDEEEVIKEVENAREELRRAVAGGGERVSSFTTSSGSYFIELISIEKPGLGSQEAYLEIDDVSSIVTINDKINDWVVVNITENSIVLKNLSDYEETIATGSLRYIDGTKIKLLKTVLRREAKVTVLPLESTRQTITNFTVQIGIEKRAIKLSPEKTKELIENLNKKITQLENARDNLEKIIGTWKKACFAGATALWIKNFVSGLSGEAYARKLVMEPWTNLCSDSAYMKSINAKSISDCYRINEKNINDDIALVKGALQKTNSFISSVKAIEGVTTKGGLLGLGKTINDTKFMIEVQKNFPADLKNIEIYEEREIRKIVASDGKIEFEDNGVKKIYANVDALLAEKPNVDRKKTAKLLERKINSNDIIGNITLLYEKGRIFRDDVKDIVLNLEIYKECQNKRGSSVLCKDAIRKSYTNLKVPEQIEELNSVSSFKSKFGIDPILLKQKEKEMLKSPIYVADSNFINKIDFKNYPKIEIGEKYVIFSSTINYIAVVEQATGHDFVIRKLYEVSLGETVTVNNFYNENALQKKLDELKIAGVEEIDVNLCNNNEIKAPYRNEIKFWESGPYQGFVAMMPIDVRAGWYMATTSYSGLEGAMVAWKENADINTFWICNVGLDGIPNFDFSSGPKGDDCCTQVVLATGAQYEIAGCTTPSCSSQLINRAKECARNAIIEFSAGKRTIDTKGCGKFNLGKPPVSRPTVQCEDFMSPSDCRLMYNLCDPVMCPASRCDFGGRMPVENVIQSGIIGSLVLCWPNFEDGRGVLVPICLTGVHAGLDSFIGILKAGRDCLQEQLQTGKTVGICDQIMSVYICEFFWRQLDPLLKAGIPALTESLAARGGGEYVLFSESWKQSINAAHYFTDFYAVESFKAFKARSTAEIGTEVCKKYVSVAYPTQAKFWEEIAKPESPTQATACFQEIPMGGASPNSHYKVFAYIYAGRDQGVYYSIYLRRPSKPGYYEQFIPEEYLVKDGYGYLAAGQYLSISPDFIAPSGYKEIVIRLNDREVSGFADCASTSFAIQELQNYYLKDQLEKEITTAKECVSGKPTIIPVASLNIQNIIEKSLEPQIYRRGIIRICSTKNPGEATEPNRYKRIGYCDNKDVGCWLDMNSVNESISDLGIRVEIINKSEEKDIGYLIETFRLNTPRESQEQLNAIEPQLLKISEKVNSFIEKIKKNQLTKELTKEQINAEIKEIDKEITEIIANLSAIRDKCARTEEKARAEFNIAKLYDFKAKLYARPEVNEIEEKIEEAGKIEKEKTCSDLKGVWRDSCKGYGQDKTDEVGEKDKSQNPNKKCCVKLDLFPIDVENIVVKSCYNNKKDYLSLDVRTNTDLKAIADGKVIELKEIEYDYGVEVTITIDHGNFYSRYKGTMISPEVKERGFIKKDSVIGKVSHAISGTTLPFEYFYFSIYDKDPTKNKGVKGENPFCYFTEEIQNKFYDKCKSNIEECRQGQAKSLPIEFTWPVPSVYHIQESGGYFHDSRSQNIGGKHYGIDIGKEEGSEGEEVIAVYDGTVVSVERNCKCDNYNEANAACNGRMGNAIIIKHTINGKEVYSIYMHLKEESIPDNIKENSFVKKGTIIGKIGKTGNACTRESYKPHLHLQINLNSLSSPEKNSVNPLCFFSSDIISKVNPIKYNAEECKKLLEQNGLILVQETPIAKEKCSNLFSAEDCNKVAGCWWDAAVPNKAKCIRCPDKCEGARVSIWDWATGLWAPPDILFKTKSDCEEIAKKQCNLDCLWINNECQKLSYEVIDKKIEETSNADELFELKEKIEINKNKIEDANYLLEEINKKLGKFEETAIKPKNVFLVHRVNGGVFTAENDLVNFDDNVEICAVIETDNGFFSYDNFMLGNRKIKKYNRMEPTFKWFNIKPILTPFNSGKPYKIDGFSENDEEYWDIIQYEQKEISNGIFNKGWCINQKQVNPKEGTYWYRVEITVGDKTYSSLGRPATSGDKEEYKKTLAECGNINFDKYDNYWNTLLEPNAIEGCAGISKEVKRISRKSNYAETICKENGYNSNNIRCQFLSTVEAFKNVPFAYGVIYYNNQDHHSKNFIAVDCINLMISSLSKATGVDLYSRYSNKKRLFGAFISENEIFKLDGVTPIEKIDINQILGSKIPFNDFSNPNTLKVGDILFQFDERKGVYGVYDNTLILYSDANNNKVLDKDDLIICANSDCHRGDLCLLHPDHYQGKFTIVRPNLLEKNV